MEEFHSQVKSIKGDKFAAILVANKLDEEENRAVSSEEGSHFAKRIGAKYFECSAKTGANLQEAFGCLLEMMTRNLESSKKENFTEKTKKGHCLQCACDCKIC